MKGITYQKLQRYMMEGSYGQYVDQLVKEIPYNVLDKLQKLSDHDFQEVLSLVKERKEEKSTENENMKKKEACKNHRKDNRVFV